MISLSRLIGAGIHVVRMVELFAREGKLSDKLKYEIARNSMMLTVFSVACEMDDEEAGKRYLSKLSKKLCDFESFQSYEDYYLSHKDSGVKQLEEFDKCMDGLIAEYRNEREE